MKICRDCKWYACEYEFDIKKNCTNQKMWDCFCWFYCDSFYLDDENFGCIFWEKKGEEK